ncbi:MAG: leucyl aminopeptidase [Candidatus Omnitrophica bacterium]|nr:leucyl aminopeptidase [Candidatus Omnitrophota bacterium]
MISFRDTFKFDKASVAFLSSDQIKAKACGLEGQGVCDAARGVIESGQFEGKKGQVFPLVVDKKVLVLFGLGAEKDLTASALRALVRRAFMLPYFKTEKTLIVVPHADKAWVVQSIIEGVTIGTYAWKKYISKKADDKTIDRKDVVIVAKKSPGYEAISTVADNVNVARELVNENADVTTPVMLEGVVRKIVKGKKGITLEVLDRAKLKARKLGLLLAVNQGSNKEPRVVIVKYTGAGKDKPYTAIVGKGLTFDSGGLNLKPSGHMETMRCDMSGAATVIGTLKTALELKLKKNIIFAFGAVENAIDANAYKPGDVFTGHAGKSVEIGNTDAEGRLVLADVLSYVITTYKPAKVIDLATLTGACVVALGNDYAALLSTDNTMAEALLSSAEATDDRLWRLPLYPELKDAMKSKIADIKNTSNLKGAAGTLTGAEFLRFFVGDVPWAHLDIAGVAFVDGDSRQYYAHGATGYGVRLLTHYLSND